MTFFALLVEMGESQGLRPSIIRFLTALTGPFGSLLVHVKTFFVSNLFAESRASYTHGREYK